MKRALTSAVFLSLFLCGPSHARTDEVQVLGTFKTLKFGVRCAADVKPLKVCEPEVKWVVLNAPCELVYPDNPQLKPFKIELNGECDSGAGAPPDAQACIAAATKGLIKKVIPNASDFKFNESGTGK